MKSARAREIRGWMRRGELRWLEKVSSSCDLVIEIGTWQGRSTYAMGENVKGKVIAIDPFTPEKMESKSQRITYRRHYPVDISIIQDDPDLMYRLCLKNLDPLIQSGKVEVIRGRSDKVINDLQYLKGKVDMVFIDGDHSYEPVKRDINDYRPLVKPGGLLCGHDYGYYVKQAVDETLPGVKVARGTTIWVSRC
jgi:predicted O-methyltransferase YrrM